MSNVTVRLPHNTRCGNLEEPIGPQCCDKKKYINITYYNTTAFEFGFRVWIEFVKILQNNYSFSFKK